jgi:hypothetical protein
VSAGLSGPSLPLEILIGKNTAFRPLRNSNVKKLRLHFLALLSKAAKNPRLSQAQATQEETRQKLSEAWILT